MPGEITCQTRESNSSIGLGWGCVLRFSNTLTKFNLNTDNIYIDNTWN